MKKLKEINLAPSIDRGDSPHVRAKQPMGLVGNSGSPRDSAISQYSSWMGHKKATLEEEESEEEIDLMPESILKYRVRIERGYSLNETLKLINEDTLNESFTGIIKVGLMSLLDDATGELSGLIAVLPLLYKNVLELHTTNKKLESLIASGSKDVEAFKAIRLSLASDLKDILEAVVIAAPIPAIDSILAGLLTITNAETIGTASVYFGEKYADFAQNNPKLATVLKYIGYMLGFPVISKSMENIDRLSDSMIATTMSGAVLVKPYDEIPEAEIIEIVQDEISEGYRRLSFNMLGENQDIKELDYYGIDEELGSYDEDLEGVEEHFVGGYATPLRTPTKAEQEKLMTFKEDLQRLQDWKLKTTGRTR